MATEDAELPEVEPTPSAEVAAPLPATPEAVTSEVSSAPTPTPAPPEHDPWLVHQAKELNLTADEIAVMSPVELQRSVVLLARQQARLAQAVAQPKPETPTPPPPEPEWDLPAEVKAELEEMNPALVKAITLAGRVADQKQKELKAELAQVRQQNAGQAVRTQVLTELSKALGLGGAPLVENSPEFWKGEAILNQCRLMQQSGMVPPDAPPAQTIAMAKKMLGLPDAPAPATPAPAPSRPAPTPSAKPSRRLQEGTDGLSAREALLAEYASKMEQWDSEDAENKPSRNGSFKP